MNKRVNLISLVCYAILLVASLALVITMIITYFQNKDDGDLGTGLTAAFAIVFAIISGIYAITTAIPMIFKEFAIRSGRKVFTVLCIPFDVILTVFNAILVINLLSEPEPISFVLFGLILLVSLTALTLNIITLITIKKTEDKSPSNV